MKPITVDEAAAIVQAALAVRHPGKGWAVRDASDAVTAYLIGFGPPEGTPLLEWPTDLPMAVVDKATGTLTFEQYDWRRVAAAKPLVLAVTAAGVHTGSDTEETDMTTLAADEPTGPPLHGVLAPEGIRTGDGRSFAEGSMRWRDLPLPLMVQNANDEGHRGAIRVARIDTITRDDSGPITKVRFTGSWAVGDDGDLTEAAAAARAEVRSRVLRGVSVDLDDTTVEFLNSETGEPLEDDEDGMLVALFGGPEPLMNVIDGRISGATMCSIPAFQQAYVADGEWVPGSPEPGDDDYEPVLAVEPAEIQMVGMMPDGETPCSCDPNDADYDPDCVCEPVVAAAVFVSEKPWGGFTEADYTDQQWADACLIALDPEEGQDPLTKSLHKLPVYEPGGALNRAGCHAAASVLGGGRGGVDAPPDKIESAARKLAGLYRSQLDEEPPDSLLRKAGEEATVLPAMRLVASGIPTYEASDFTDPCFEGPTALTVTDDGRIYGHLALWGTCHVGFDGVCVEPPNSNTGYAYFRTGSVRTTDGEVPVGTITLGTGHAAATLGHRPAVAHYDDTGLAVADIAVGDDDYGIWYNGRLRPGTSDEKIIALRHGGALSGDWRRIGGGLELVAALAVNVPGFPVPRATVAASGGRQISLVASGVVGPEVMAAREGQPVDLDAVTASVIAVLDRRAKVERLARRVGRDRVSRRQAALRIIGSKED